MGESLFANCSCGYHTEILTGGGGIGRCCYLPCYCPKCDAVTSANMLAKKLKCAECSENNVILYGHTEKAEKAISTPIQRFTFDDYPDRFVKLMTGAYRCPKCGQKMLMFSHGRTLWD
jgi:Zn finger protein HypA/HybF involved in hydrogenase expression